MFRNLNLGAKIATGFVIPVRQGKPRRLSENSELFQGLCTLKSAENDLKMR